jgi:hypothetical protein
MPAQSPTLSPDVVGDHGRVARVVLGDPRLDLADQVGADVGGLREDAASQSREDRDQRAAEAEADERVHGLLVGLVGEHEDAEVAGHAQQGQADHQEPGDRAALEGHVERRWHAAARRLGDTGVGAHREVHPDEAGRAGERAADQEADRREHVALDDPQEDRERQGHHADDRVLALEVRLCALLDRAGDLLHAVVAGRAAEQPARDDGAVDDGGDRAYERDDHPVIGQKVSQVEVLRWVIPSESDRGSGRRGAGSLATDPAS